MNTVEKKQSQGSKSSESGHECLMSLNVSGRGAYPDELDSLVANDEEIKNAYRAEKLQIYRESPLAVIDTKINTRRASSVSEYLKRRGDQPELKDIVTARTAMQGLNELLIQFEDFASQSQAFRAVLEKSRKIIEELNQGSSAHDLLWMESILAGDNSELSKFFQRHLLPSQQELVCELKADLRILEDEGRTLMPAYQKIQRKAQNLWVTFSHLAGGQAIGDEITNSCFLDIASNLKRLTLDSGDIRSRVSGLTLIVNDCITELRECIERSAEKVFTLIASWEEKVKLFGHLPNESDNGSSSNLAVEAEKHLAILDQEMLPARVHSRKISTPFQKLCALCHFHAIGDVGKSEQLLQSLKQQKVKQLELDFERIRKSGDYPQETLEEVARALEGQGIVIKIKKSREAPVSTSGNARASHGSELEELLSDYISDKDLRASIKWALNECKDPLSEALHVVGSLEDTVGSATIVRELIATNPDLLLLSSKDKAGFEVYCAWLEQYLPVMVRMIEQGDYAPKYFASLEALQELWKSAQERPSEELKVKAENGVNRDPNEQQLIEMIASAGYEHPELAYAILRYGLYYQGRYLANTERQPTEYNRTRVDRCFTPEAKPTTKEFNNTVKRLAADKAIVYNSSDVYVINHKTREPDAPKGIMLDVIGRILDPENKPGPVVKFSKVRRQLEPK